MKVSRLAEISRVFVAAGLHRSEGKPGRSDAAEHTSDVERAKRLRGALEKLGPTFVKFGQILATRVDLFSEDFIRELGKLRSHVPAFSREEAQAIIEAELGRPLAEVFSDFPEQPVASASIAQVYRARLKDGGEWLAVKVQRPHLQEMVSSDLDVLIDVSKTIDWLVPAYHRSMVHQVAAEYAARARLEMDFLAEARAMERFSEVLATLPEFRAPEVRKELCTERLLVMEWFEGPLLEDIPGPRALRERGMSPQFLASAMLRLQLGMSYEHGFVHGDTHPGNIILLENGQLGLIDFGLHGIVSRQLCDKMLELLYYQSSGHRDDAVAAFLRIFAPAPDAKLEGFEEELRTILETHEAPDAKGNKLTAQLVEGLRLGARYQLRAQSELFVVLRNLAIVEGIVLTYCPELDLMNEVRSILQGILLRRALGSPLNGEYKELLPMLMLTLSQRPQVAEKLLRLVRSFADSRDLGEFLEHEGVFNHQRVAPERVSWKTVAISLLIGALLATVWHLLQTGACSPHTVTLLS
jgi:ubiquinone biosynthesis protein